MRRGNLPDGAHDKATWNVETAATPELREIVRRGYIEKCFFRGISWNAYFKIVSLCKLPRNVHHILSELFHEIWKFWKSIFRIFSIVKDFSIKFVFILDWFFYYQWRLQKLSGFSWYFILNNLKVDWSSLFRIMNE